MPYPYYPSPYYQPYNPPQQQQQQSTNVIWVNNETEAKNYPVAPGNTVILMDNDNPVAYKKTTDFSGRSLPLEVYDLVPREKPKEENHQINLDEYLQKKEFDAFLDKLDKRFAEITEQEIVVMKKKKEDAK